VVELLEGPQQLLAQEDLASTAQKLCFVSVHTNSSNKHEAKASGTKLVS